MDVCMFVTYTSYLSFDARKKIIIALGRVILWTRFFNFYLGAEIFKCKVSQVGSSILAD